MADATLERSRLATVFGGSGFVGRHIVRALARKGWRVRVAVRRPDLAAFVQTAGAVGQILPVQANLRYPASVAAALEGAEMVVNATGVKAESGAQTYQAVHVDGAAALALAAKAAGVEAYVHVSGLGADPRSASPYIASKGRGETATLEAFPRRSFFVLRSSSARKTTSSTDSARSPASCPSFRSLAAARRVCSPSTRATSREQPPRRWTDRRSPGRSTSSAARSS